MQQSLQLLLLRTKVRQKSDSKDFEIESVPLCRDTLIAVLSAFFSERVPVGSLHTNIVSFHIFCNIVIYLVSVQPMARRS